MHGHPAGATIEAPDGVDWDLVMRVSAARGFMTADSVAAAVVLLASDDASSIHGSIQLVDQGHRAGRGEHLG